MTEAEDGAEILEMIVALAMLVPILATGARRLHDSHKSGWWQLFVRSGRRLACSGDLFPDTWRARRQPFWPASIRLAGDRFRRHPVMFMSATGDFAEEHLEKAAKIIAFYGRTQVFVIEECFHLFVDPFGSSECGLKRGLRGGLFCGGRGVASALSSAVRSATLSPASTPASIPASRDARASSRLPASSKILDFKVGNIGNHMGLYNVHAGFLGLAAQITQWNEDHLAVHDDEQVRAGDTSCFIPIGSSGNELLALCWRRTIIDLAIRTKNLTLLKVRAFAGERPEGTTLQPAPLHGST